MLLRSPRKRNRLKQCYCSNTSGKDWWNRWCVFRRWQKIDKEADDWMSGGREFQRILTILCLLCNVCLCVVLVCYPQCLCRSAWIGRLMPFVCLFVCPRHNSKTKDPKVFKLCMGNNLEVMYGFGVEKSKIKITGSLSAFFLHFHDNNWSLT